MPSLAWSPLRCSSTFLSFPSLFPYFGWFRLCHCFYCVRSLSSLCCFPFLTISCALALPFFQCPYSPVRNFLPWAHVCIPRLEVWFRMHHLRPGCVSDRPTDGLIEGAEMGVGAEFDVLSLSAPHLSFSSWRLCQPLFHRVWLRSVHSCAAHWGKWEILVKNLVYHQEGVFMLSVWAFQGFSLKFRDSLLLFWFVVCVYISVGPIRSDWSEQRERRIRVQSDDYRQQKHVCISCLKCLLS